MKCNRPTKKKLPKMVRDEENNLHLESDFFLSTTHSRVLHSAVAAMHMPATHLSAVEMLVCIVMVQQVMYFHTHSLIQTSHLKQVGLFVFVSQYTRARTHTRAHTRTHTQFTSFVLFCFVLVCFVVLCFVFFFNLIARGHMVHDRPPGGWTRPDLVMIITII